MSITSAAALTSTTGTALTSLAVTATAAKDVWVLWIVTKNASVTVSNVTSSRATWQLAAGPWLDGTGAANEHIYIGTMSSAGADTINITYSASITGIGVDIDAHPFHSSLASPVWTPDAIGDSANSSSTTVQFPFLTPNINTVTGELYWGHARVPGSATTPSSGYTANNDANGNPEMYNVAVTASAFPTMQQSPAATSNTIAIMLAETATNVSGSMSAAAHPATALLNGTVPYVGTLTTGNTAPATAAFNGAISLTGAMSAPVRGAATFGASGNSAAVGPSLPLVKNFTSQSGTGGTCTLTLSSPPSVGDLMFAIFALDTPTTVQAPSIFTTNIVDTWVPILGMQDTQRHDDGQGLRVCGFYKTANATDATQSSFTFNFPAMVDNSQGGLPQFPTTDFAGLLVTFQASGLGTVGFDTASPQNNPPNGNNKKYQLPSINTKGILDTFLSVFATYGQPSVSHTDPSASLVVSVANTTPTYVSQALTLALWASTNQGVNYPFSFQTTQSSQFGDVLTATLGIRTATNFYYNGPFARMGYPYEGADQRLITRYPTHWAFTTLITAGVPLIGQTFSQDQLAAADRYYMGKTLLNPSTDFNLILNAGIGGDFTVS